MLTMKRALCKSETAVTQLPYPHLVGWKRLMRIGKTSVGMLLLGKYCSRDASEAGQPDAITKHYFIHR